MRIAGHCRKPVLISEKRTRPLTHSFDTWESVVRGDRQLRLTFAVCWFGDGTPVPCLVPVRRIRGELLAEDCKVEGCLGCGSGRVEGGDLDTAGVSGSAADAGDDRAG